MKVITIMCLAAGVLALPVIPAEQPEAPAEKRQNPNPVAALEQFASTTLAIGNYLVGPDPEFRKRESEESLTAKRQDPGEALEGVAGTALAVVGLGGYLIECEVPGGYCPDFRKRQSDSSPSLPPIYDLPTPTELLTGFGRIVACVTGENCLS